MWVPFLASTGVGVGIGIVFTHLCKIKSRHVGEGYARTSLPCIFFNHLNPRPLESLNPAFHSMKGLQSLFKFQKRVAVAVSGEVCLTGFEIMRPK